MSKKPLYIELLTYLDTTQQGEEWVDLGDAYRQKLTHVDFYSSFKEEINFLAENGDILITGNLKENPEAANLILSGQITEGGEEYLRSYKFAREEDKDRFSTNQIILLMLGIIAGTVLLAFALAYFSDKPLF